MGELTCVEKRERIEWSEIRGLLQLPEFKACENLVDERSGAACYAGAGNLPKSQVPQGFIGPG